MHQYISHQPFYIDEFYINSMHDILIVKNDKIVINHNNKMYFEIVL